MQLCSSCSTPCLEEHQFCPTCGSSMDLGGGEHQDPYIGLTISGKFILREMIGSGGMGKVYRADQIGVGRTVAVKIMHRHLMGDETAAARFTNEARACSHLNHPNSISVLDFGQTREASLYIIYEYLRGRSLDVVLREEFPLNFGRVAGMLCQAMGAVDAAHQLTIIHRDLKPENIFLEETAGTDFVKVLDFGIAKILDLTDRSITSPGMVPGTPEYMSPEQAKGEELDPRSDVYSLGVILYELLTNSVPFSGSSAVATMMSHVQDPPEPPSRRRPDRQIPKDLESIVLWALAKKIGDRISSASHFRDLLSSWAIKSGLWPSRREVRSHQTLDAARLVIDSIEIETGEREVVDHDPREAATVSATEQLSPGQAAAPPPRILGREQELEQLDVFLQQEEGKSLLIQAAAGAGKSSIIREAMRRARAAGYVVIDCPPDSGWTPIVLGAARRSALRCLGLEEVLAPGIEEVLQAAGQIGLDADDIPGVKELFGITGHLKVAAPETRARERRIAYRQLFQKVAAGKRLLVVFQDIQRFDETSRELALDLAAVSQDRQLSVIISRTSDTQSSQDPELPTLDLGPLSPEASAAFTASLFNEEVEPELIDEIVSVGMGQPLFLAQLACARVLEGLARTPQKLADLVATRIERLPQNERELLQGISVLNEQITARSCALLFKIREAPKLLAQLVEKGFLKKAAQGKVEFVHHMVAMVVYSSIPAEVRRGMHRKVAGYQRRTDVSICVLAHHSYEADDGIRAIEELDQAGSTAVDSMDYRAAIPNFSRAMEMVRREWGKGRMHEQELEQLTVGLARRLAQVLMKTDEPRTARGILEEALSFAAGHDASRGELRLDLARISMEHGDLQRALRHLDLARNDAESSKSDYLLGEVLREFARVKGLLGEQEYAGELILESLNASRRASGHHKEPSWEILLEVAMTCSQIGLKGRARGYLLDALQEAEMGRSIPGKLRVIRQMANVHLSCKEWDEAEIRLNQAINLVAQIGDRTCESSLLIDLGRLYRIRGDVEQARRRLDKAACKAKVVGWSEGLERITSEIEMLKYAVPSAL